MSPKDVRTQLARIKKTTTFEASEVLGYLPNTPDMVDCETRDHEISILHIKVLQEIADAGGKSGRLAKAALESEEIDQRCYIYEQ